MNLDALRTRIINFKDCVIEKSNKYNEILTDLGTIKSKYKGQNEELKLSINTLYDEYTEAINYIDNNIIRDIDEMLKYLDSTTDNFLQLAKNLRTTVKVYNDIVSLFD